MKTSNVRFLLVAGLAGALAATVGCGSSGGAPADGGGGKGGTGGGGGKGGSGGGTGGTVTHKVNYTFDSSTQNFMLNTYFEPANLGGLAPVDGGTDGGSGDAGAPLASVTFEPADGSPANGSLKVSATFTDYNKYVDAIINLPSALDLTGRTLHGKVKLVSTSAPFPGGIQFHVSTGANYTYAGMPGLVVPAVGAWGDIAADLTALSAAGFDPTMVVQMGVQFYSGSAPAGGPATLAAPITAVFLVDTITD
jgi:hypothetical protein